MNRKPKEEEILLLIFRIFFSFFVFFLFLFIHFCFPFSQKEKRYLQLYGKLKLLEGVIFLLLFYHCYFYYQYFAVTYNSHSYHKI